VFKYLNSHYYSNSSRSVTDANIVAVEIPWRYEVTSQNCDETAIKLPQQIIWFKRFFLIISPAAYKIWYRQRVRVIIGD